LGFLLKVAKALPFMPLFSFKMQPIFVEDVSKIIETCLKTEKNKTINLPGPETVSFKDFLKILKTLGIKFFMINLPWFFNFLFKIFSYLPFFPYRSWQVKSLLNHKVVEPPDFENMFQIKPTLLKEGLKKTIGTIR